MTMRATASSLALFALVGAASAGAQAPVPASARAPRDTQPALIKPKAPSAPPSAVAPRAAANRPSATADTVALRPPARVGLPVDSVRPTRPRAVEPDPAHAPALRPEGPPPRPTAAATPAPAAPATLRADDPPADAKAHCKDGTWISAAVTASTCAQNGGLSVILPQKQAPKRPTPH